MAPRLSVIFCEDIRHEIGGKKSLMGILGERILVKKMPFTFSKLCCHFSVELPEGQSPKQSMIIKLFLDGTEMQGVDIPAEAFKDKDISDHGWTKVVGGIDAGNFQINTPCEISLSLFIDGVEFNTPYSSMHVDLDESIESEE